MRKAIIQTIAPAAGTLGLLILAGNWELAEAKPVNCERKQIECQKRCRDRYPESDPARQQAVDCYIRTCDKQFTNCKRPEPSPKGSDGGGYHTDPNPRPKGVPTGGYYAHPNPRPKGIPAGGGYNTGPASPKGPIFRSGRSKR